MAIYLKGGKFYKNWNSKNATQKNYYFIQKLLRNVFICRAQGYVKKCILLLIEKNQILQTMCKKYVSLCI